MYIVSNLTAMQSWRDSATLNCRIGLGHYHSGRDKTWKGVWRRVRYYTCMHARSIAGRSMLHEFVGIPEHVRLHNCVWGFVSSFFLYLRSKCFVRSIFYYTKINPMASATLSEKYYCWTASLIIFKKSNVNLRFNIILIKKKKKKKTHRIFAVPGGFL